MPPRSAFKTRVTSKPPKDDEADPGAPGQKNLFRRKPAPVDDDEDADAEDESPSEPEVQDDDEDDEESKYVTPMDVKKAGAFATAPATDKMPGQSGFIAELVAGAGQKLHETEYGPTGHPVFIHGPADERIWTALGRYVESQLDITKYGVVILLVVLLGSESMKFAVYGKFRADEAKKAETKKGKK